MSGKRQRPRDSVLQPDFPPDLVCPRSLTPSARGRLQVPLSGASLVSCWHSCRVPCPPPADTGPGASRSSHWLTSLRCGFRLVSFAPWVSAFVQTNRILDAQWGFRREWRQTSVVKPPSRSGVPVCFDSQDPLRCSTSVDPVNLGMSWGSPGHACLSRAAFGLQLHLLLFCGDRPWSPSVS